MSLLNKLIHFKKTHRDYKRFVDVVNILSRYGFEEFLYSFSKDRKILKFLRPKRKSAGRPTPEIVRHIIEELGPTYIKFGQILSTRNDLIPEEYIVELRKLQENVPPFEFKEVERIFKEDFGASVHQLYKKFDPKPIAAASIGQAHKAVTFEGDQVIVKVQRPNIHQTIESDLDIMIFLARQIENRIEDIRLLHPVSVIEEFQYSIRQEMNYIMEAANIRHFADIMGEQKNIVVPKVYDDLSSARVITMERIDGISSTTLLRKPALRANYDMESLALTTINAFYSQVLDHGFFHADPHPGNIFILPDNKVSFIDFGMMSSVTAEERWIFVSALSKMLEDDFPKMTDYFVRLTHYDKKPDLNTLTRDLADIVNANIHLPMERFNFGRILDNILVVLKRHRLFLRPNLYIMFKAIMSLENLVKQFDPKLMVVPLMEPFMRKIKMRSLDPRIYVREFLENAGDNLHAINYLPIEMREFIQKTKDGEIGFKMEHHGLAPFYETLTKVADRLAVAIVLASIVVGSSLIVHSKIPPLVWDISVIGIIGYVISAALGLHLVIVHFTDHAPKD